MERIVIKPEKFSAIASELQPLLIAHYDETSTDKDGIEVDMDWGVYLALEVAGMLHCMVVRHNGVLVGYFINFLQPHLHHKGLYTAISDMIYVMPQFRKGTGIGSRLIKETEIELKKLGVKKMYFITKKGFLETVAERLGFRPIEVIHSKWLGD